MDKKIKIIFPASMKDVGLLYHFTLLSCEFAKQLRGTKFSFLMLTEKGEQNAGLLDIIEQNLNGDEYKICDSYQDFYTVLDENLNDVNFEKVIYLSQGLAQFYHIRSLKKSYKSKLKIYIRLNAFRHGSLVRYPLSFVFSFLFKKYADAVNFQCFYTSRRFLNSRAIFRSGIGTVIPLGLNKEDLLKNKEQFHLNEIMEDNRFFKIVYLAQFHKHKKHKELIQSLRPLFESNSNIRLICFGSGSEFNNISRLCADLNLSDRVVLPGRIDRKYIPYYLSKSNLSIVFSSIETFGHNILEPLFYGVPVITTKVGIAEDVIIDFYNGYVLKSWNYNQLPKIIESFVGSNITKYDVSKTVAHYSWENIVRAYKQMFEYLIKI